VLEAADLSLEASLMLLLKQRVGVRIEPIEAKSELGYQPGNARADNGGAKKRFGRESLRN
jgi:hypothetical protein